MIDSAAGTTWYRLLSSVRLANADWICSIPWLAKEFLKLVSGPAGPSLPSRRPLAPLALYMGSTSLPECWRWAAGVFGSATASTESNCYTATQWRSRFGGGRFDAVFMSFTLELFDTPEIPQVVRECRRVLQAEGRICIVSLSKSRRPGTLEQLYERLHVAFPIIFDCRPIHVAPSVITAGFEVVSERAGNLWGLPVAIVLASKPNPLREGVPPIAS